MAVTYNQAILTLPGILKTRITDAMYNLYNNSLSDVKVTFDKLLQDLEKLLGVNHISVCKLALMFTQEISSYVGFEDAEWLISQRRGRMPEEHLARLFTHYYLYSSNEKFAEGRYLLESLNGEEYVEGNPIKKLLVKALNVMPLVEHYKTEEARALLNSVRVLQTEATQFVSQQGRLSEELCFYLVKAADELNFFFKKNGYHEEASKCLQEVLDVNERYGRDTGLDIQTLTYLLNTRRYLPQSQADRLILEKLFSKVQEANSDVKNFLLLNRVRLLRGAFWQMAQTGKKLMFTPFRSDIPILLMGKNVLEAVKGILPQNHPEVVFMASNLAWMLKNPKRLVTYPGYIDDAKAYHDFATENWIKLGEETKLHLDMKARSCENFCNYLDDQREKEMYARERLRLQKLLCSDQYVAQAMRSLALIVEASRPQECLALLKEALSLVNPEFKEYIERLEADIARVEQR